MHPSDVPVVILCGGEGTRLREETQARPKPLIDIGTEPILMHIMRLYSAYGFRRFVLCLGYRGMMIKAWAACDDDLGELSKQQIARYSEDAAARRAAMLDTISVPSTPEPQLS